MQSLNSATCDPGARHAPSAEDVRAELERILASPHLQGSERRRAFLRFIVEETLAGRADRLKGYTIAVAVFGRDETFDARSDPVVRLEARRLRRDLDSYYVDAGSRDAVRLSIPKGSYVPRFEWQEGTRSVAVSDEVPAARSDALLDAPPANGVPGGFDTIARFGRTPSRNLLVAALVAALIAVAAAGWILTAGKSPSGAGDAVHGPAVIVLPFEALGSTDYSRYLASSISQELIVDLMRFPGFRLYTLPIDSEKDASRGLTELGRDLGMTYVVQGSVRDDTEDLHVMVRLSEIRTGRVLWTESYDRPLIPDALIRVQNDLAGEIASTLGQPYGIVNHDLQAQFTTPAVSSMQSYVCVLRTHSYRRGFSREEFAPVLGCLEETVRRDPDYSDAWAMLGWLYLDAGRFGYTGDGKLQDHYDKALQAASRALQLEPDNTLALKALSSVNHYLGRYDDGERFARRALAVNSHDPDTLAQLGWRLAVRGEFEAGIPFLKRAIERTVNPPGWYYHLVAIDLYLKGDYERMLRVAERSAIDGSDVSQALIAIAAGELGNRDAAREALDRISAYGLLARDSAAFFRRHGATDEIVDALMGGLRKARRITSGSL